jgi:alpha-mannosidase
VWVEGRRAGNGLITLQLGAAGVEQVWDRQGMPQLADALAWRRYGDRGEFWDAWDLAADYGAHPLPWCWQGEPRWCELGPLCAHFVWHGRCGGSSVRLDGRILAGSPWLELVFSVNWCQRHELLRLEVPLRQRADRWAADTSGGVLERPAEPCNPREQARWEVAAVSWLASCAPAGGLALLLDGPQGVSARPDQLGVSLLRAPTWPDPGADNGRVRQRLALLPCAGSWRAAAVPDQAQSFREPLWLRPLSAAPRSAAHPPAEHPFADPGAARTALPPLPEGVQLLGLRRLDGVAAVIGLANLSPCRQRFGLGDRWWIESRLNGLDQPIACWDGSDLVLRPWELGFWRVKPSRRSAQSS